MIKPGELSTEEAAAKAGKLSPEQAAILASATRTEAELSGQVQHDGQGNLIEPEAARPDQGAENLQLLTMLVMMATPVFPFLPTCYTPEVIAQIAGAFTAVEEKYGWHIGGNIGPELALAIFAIPPTITAYSLGKAHFAELKARREAENGRQPAKTAASDARADAVGAP